MSRLIHCIVVVLLVVAGVQRVAAFVLRANLGRSQGVGRECFQTGRFAARFGIAAAVDPFPHAFRLRREPDGRQGPRRQGRSQPGGPGSASVGTGGRRPGAGLESSPFPAGQQEETATLMDVDGAGSDSAHLDDRRRDPSEYPSRLLGRRGFAVDRSACVRLFRRRPRQVGAGDSLAVVVNPQNAMNCYWPMPFRKHVRVTLTNESPDKDMQLLAYQIDYAEHGNTRQRRLLPRPVSLPPHRTGRIRT